MNTRLKLLICAAALAAATGAHAQAAPKLALKPYAVEAAPKGIDGWADKTPRAGAFAQGNALRAAGIARTSMDRRFDDKDTKGSLGFLCGIQPGQELGGAAAAHGSDPQGRFLGAKLSRAF